MLTRNKTDLINDANLIINPRTIPIIKKWQIRMFVVKRFVEVPVKWVILNILTRNEGYFYSRIFYSYLE